jgi:hypothetical protein
VAFRIFSLIAFILVLVQAPPATLWAQAPYAPQAPMMPPQGPPAQGGQGQQPSEYAFKPDLSNPQYGQCLQMERQWKGLWNQYYQLYYQHRQMNPADPSYGQLSHHLGALKMQLDAAWQQFSSQCIYFRSRR